MENFFDLTVCYNDPVSTFSYLTNIRLAIEESILDVEENIAKESISLTRAERLSWDVSSTDEDKLRYETTLKLCPKRISLYRQRLDLLNQTLAICSMRLEVYINAGYSVDSIHSIQKTVIGNLDDHIKSISRT